MKDGVLSNASQSPRCSHVAAAKRLTPELDRYLHIKSLCRPLSVDVRAFLKVERKTQRQRSVSIRHKSAILGPRSFKSSPRWCPKTIEWPRGVRNRCMAQRWVNASLASTTLAQHWAIDGQIFRLVSRCVFSYDGCNCIIYARKIRHSMFDCEIFSN